MNKDADIILHFWFKESPPERWWKKDQAFDYEIKARFGHLMKDAAAGRLDSWAGEVNSTLALILLLDQFPRNVYRGTAQAFATDEKARFLTLLALERDYIKDFDLNHCVFTFLPLEHSEDAGDQAMCVELFRALGNENYLNFALSHQEIITRFGHFPHRNAVLGRPNTPEEEEYLKDPKAGF
ncbi:MAG: DUF924 family protein [Alphaproteobacteria bacterium]